MTKEPICIGVVVEGPSDARTVRSIIGKLLQEGGFSLRGIAERTTYSQWKDVDYEYDRLHVPK